MHHPDVFVESKEGFVGQDTLPRLVLFLCALGGVCGCACGDIAKLDVWASVWTLVNCFSLEKQIGRAHV